MQGIKIYLNNHEYEVLATYEDDNRNKKFIVYSDGSYVDGKLNICYGQYELNNGKFEIFAIDNVEDEKMIQEEIKKLVIEINS